MNPYLLCLSFAAQVLVLQSFSPWPSGLLSGLSVAALLSVLAFTRLRWGAHLDMYLAMIGWGGLGMMLPGLHYGLACHHIFNWQHYALMSGGMWLFALPPMWLGARCLIQARAEGYGSALLILDGLGMQLGMGLAHLPLSWLPMGDPRVIWFSHASMLLGMTLGMMAAQGLFQWDDGKTRVKTETLNTA